MKSADNNNGRKKVDPPGYAAKIATNCFFEADYINAVPVISPVAAEGDYLTATLTYTNLPNASEFFGMKAVRLFHVSISNPVASNRFAAFYPKYALNAHFAKAPNPYPNWFYYWQQGKALTDANGNNAMAGCVYDPNVGYGLADYQSGNIRLGRLAASTNDGSYTVINSTTLAEMVVGNNGRGIKCVAETLQHELEHFKIYNQFYKYVNTPADGDGDWIPDMAECGYDMISGQYDLHEPGYGGVASDPNKKDTYNLATVIKFQPFSLSGDREMRCYLRERDNTIQIHPDRDWANPGSQHKNKP